VLIGPVEISFRRSLKGAAEPLPSYEERLVAVEEALDQLVDQFDVLNSRIKSWASRQAAQKRAQALKAIEEIPESTDAEIVDPASSVAHVSHPDEMSTIDRARMKAEIRRRALGA
jgi:hypothetical protein